MMRPNESQPPGNETDLKLLRATRQIDAACDAYERAMGDGDPPVFTAFLDAVDEPLRHDLVRELTAIASERLRNRGTANPSERLIALNAELPKALLGMVSELLAAQPTVHYSATPTSGAGTGLGGARKTGSRALRLRCPHCSNHVELLSDTAMDAIDCSICGSSFSLVDRARETQEAETLQRIDRFELIARLGLGGFGTVWKARDTELDRAVAVKIPRRGQLSADEVEQFLREARAAAQLAHPNIVPIHEVGRDGDSVFIVSDLVRGASLADELTASRPTPRDAARIVQRIAEALQHAHERGVVHRDLKPSNVMIDDVGEPRLMDFGLAKREAEEVTMTTDGQIVGTPAYMSPEQALGRSAWVDRRTDIYSLGVVLFELLTGELPFRGNAQMQVRQRTTDDAPNARRLNRHLPIDLATICARCLERDPSRRYQTAQAVVDELGRFLERRPIKARALSPIQRAVRWAERNPAQALVGALVTLLAVGGPTAAIAIESQRDRLAALLKEKDELIERRAAESTAFRNKNTAIRAELELWQGRASPSDVWPPDQNHPPKERLLASLAQSRERALAAAPDDDTDRIAAMRRNTLGLLHLAQKERSEAIADFQAAAISLERMRADSPRSAPIAAALLRTYDHLANLAAEDRGEESRWIDAAKSVAIAWAQEQPDDPLAHAERLDRELRSAIASGFDNATNQLSDAVTAEARIAELWPESPTELYRLTCHLSGEPPHLLELMAPSQDD